MATYNWGYKPNIQNRYNFVINDTADDTKPSNAVYVALFGNDAIGNGSRLRPFLTIEKAMTVYGHLIVASGVYREYIAAVGNSYYGRAIYGDGDVVFDISYRGSMFPNSGFNGGFLYNIKVVGMGTGFFSSGDLTIIKDCTFDGCAPKNDGFSTSGELITSVINSTFSNFSNNFSFNLPAHFTVGLENCTFYKINNLHLDSATSCIFSDCNILVRPNSARPRYSLFYRCNFNFNANGIGGVLYPSIPDGYLNFDDIDSLRANFQALYPTYLNTFLSCKIADPRFNNENINDFSLSFDSPAKNMSYSGTYIGAQSIGYSIKANAAGGDFDLSTNTNLIFSENSILLANPALEGSIESNVIPNLIARELATAPVYGSYADRNGQYLDATEDLSSATVSASTKLRLNTPYLVENEAITYNGAMIQPGERFTTTDVLSFVSAGSGSCREILEAPQRHTIMARFSDGDTVLSSGTALAVGHWYYASGTVTHEGVTYTNQVFKATATSPFNGSGTVVLAMSNEAYRNYEPGIKLTSNNVGDVRTGEIIRGNGDPLYERGLSKEFPINARFIQFKYIIKVNNLKP